MKMKYNVDNLNRSKYLLIRHIGYFISSIGLFYLLIVDGYTEMILKIN